MKFFPRPSFSVKRVDVRESASARGYGRRWQRYSQGRLAANPLCVQCQDAAQCTDHIQPVTGPADPLFWVPSNHQSLCRDCHGRKTATEVNGRQLRENTDGGPRT